MFVYELLEKYKLPAENIPKTIQDIELEEDVGNFKKHENINGVYYFTGEYAPDWYEGKGKLVLTLTLDLTPFSLEILNSVDDLNSLSRLNLTPSQETQLLTYPVIRFTSLIPDNFSSLVEFNLLGGLLRIS